MTVVFWACDRTVIAGDYLQVVVFKIYLQDLSAMQRPSMEKSAWYGRV